VNYGVVLRFGKRTDRVLTEGINLVWPFGIETVELIPFDLREVPFELEAITKDNVPVIINGELQYRPAHISAREFVPGKTPGTKVERKLILRFLETTDDKITTGLLGAIKNELGAISGVTLTDRFIGDRELLGLLIDTLLRLEKPSYLDTKNFPGPAPKKSLEVPVSDPRKRLDFYRHYRDQIRELLAKITDEGGSHSPLEMRYGIDVETLTLSRITFSKKVVEAMEREREEKGKQKALEVQTLQKIEMMKKLKTEAGLSGEQAHDTSDVLMGGAEKRKIIEVRGLTGGNLPIINLNGNNPS
jgi:regulator of protease activity HflC (stomatin/prohibitin superfamily)